MIIAKELLKNNFLLIENNLTYEAHTHLVVNQMIEFVKLHVKEAIREMHRVILQEGLVTDAGIGYLKNAYSLDNIK